MENFETLDKEYKEAVMELQRTAKVSIMAHHDSEVFINLFRQHFLNGSRWLYQNKGNISRSNWTYHTACSMLLTCRDMDYKTEFEVLGRHDACIRNELNEIVVYSEWEWNCHDIFGPGKELQKLITSVEKDLNANALLLTYVEDGNYKLFLKEVYETWTKETDATLYLMTPLVTKTEDISSIVSLRVVDISREFVICWAD